MNRSQISQGIRFLGDRVISDGDFAMRPGGNFHPDATAWAVVALTILDAEPDLRAAACQRLAAEQLEDGRVSISPEHPESFWPTSLAVLAWQGDPAFRDVQGRAANFLLETSGLYWKNNSKDIIGHDSNLKGWPWRSNTASWSEPTAMATMALQVVGNGGHPRVAEGIRLLLDRQIPGGGWNYGNTIVFGHVLHPMPESTGMVLNALSDQVSRQMIQESIAYLEARVTNLKTPWSLGWTLLGLSAWGGRPNYARELIERSLARQGMGRVYDTSSLALLLAAAEATNGLVRRY